MKEEELKNKEPFIDKTMENKIFIEKELKFISKFNFAEGRLEKDLLLIKLRELIREHLRNQEQLFQDALKKSREIVTNNKNTFSKERFKGLIDGIMQVEVELNKINKEKKC